MNKKLLSYISIFSLFIISSANMTAGQHPMITNKQPTELLHLIQRGSITLYSTSLPETEKENQSTSVSAVSLTYPVVDSEQVACYNDSVAITCPSANTNFYGQGGQPSKGRTPPWCCIRNLYEHSTAACLCSCKQSTPCGTPLKI